MKTTSEVTNAIFHFPFSILHSPFSILHSYAYDPAGNRTTSVWDNASATYAANGLNQYGAIVSGGVTNAVTYDACGNLTRAGTSTYQYFMGLLIHARAKDAQGVYHSSSFENDAENRRRYKHVPSGFTQPGDHYFTYSGWSLQVEDVCSGPDYWTPSASNYYVWGKDLSGTVDGAGGVGGLLATEVGGVWYFPLYDNNGTSRTTSRKRARSSRRTPTTPSAAPSPSQAPWPTRSRSASARSTSTPKAASTTTGTATTRRSWAGG